MFHYFDTNIDQGMLCTPYIITITQFCFVLGTHLKCHLNHFKIMFVIFEYQLILLKFFIIKKITYSSILFTT